MSIFEYSLSTKSQEMVPVTSYVREALKQSGVKNGICVVYCPHTTAGITINENADPDVTHDILMGLDRAIPDLPGFRHMEGNSAAHMKASYMGSSETVIVKDGALVLGTWQGIYFCEFDGPRTRKFYIKLLSD